MTSPSNNHLSADRIAELKRRYLAGEKYEVIQLEMGISANTIRRHVYRRNLPLRPHMARITKRAAIGRTKTIRVKRKP
jgi:DNA-directed RNA polymerase specialized sigma24 family protein